MVRLAKEGASSFRELVHSFAYSLFPSDSTYDNVEYVVRMHQCSVTTPIIVKNDNEQICVDLSILHIFTPLALRS